MDSPLIFQLSQRVARCTCSTRWSVCYLWAVSKQETYQPCRPMVPGSYAAIADLVRSRFSLVGQSCTQLGFDVSFAVPSHDMPDRVLSRARDTWPEHLENARGMIAPLERASGCSDDVPAWRPAKNEESCYKRKALEDAIAPPCKVAATGEHLSVTASSLSGALTGPD